MQAEWINPFVTSTISTFKTMLDCPLTRGELNLKNSNQPGYEVSGIISLEGKARGIVVLSLDRQVATKATKYIIKVSPENIDEDVIDVVCELTNMVAGAANNQLEKLQMNIGLPSVVSGKNHVIAYPTGIATISIPFECEWGALCLDASIKDTSNEFAKTENKEREDSLATI